MIKVTVLGSGSIIPTKDRFASSIYIEAESHRLILDCGPGTIEKMRRANINPWLVDGVLLTHFHVDHSSDLLPLIKLRAYDEEGNIASSPPILRVYGPRGLTTFLECLIENNEYYNYISSVFRYKRYTKIYEMDEDDFMEHDGLKIRSKKVRHKMGIMYRLEVQNKVIVFSGDTAFDPDIINIAKNADILIHECSYPKELLIGEHTSEDDLLRVVSSSMPKILLITHLYPAWRGREEDLVNKIAEKCKCRIYIAKDMLELMI